MRTLGPALILCLLVLAGCGSDFATLVPENPSRVADGLVVTRADGSSYEVNDGVARCRTDPKHPGVQIVRLIAPADADPQRRRERFLYAEVVPGVLGTRELPLDERDSAAGPSDPTLFGVDSQNRNALSASGEGRRHGDRRGGDL